MLKVHHNIFLGLDDEDDEVLGLAWDFDFIDRGIILTIKVTSLIGGKTHEKIAEDLEMALSHSQTEGFDELPADKIYKFLRTYKSKYRSQVKEGDIRGITRTIELPEEE